MEIIEAIKHFFQRVNKVKQLEKQYALTAVKPLQIEKIPLQFNSSEQPKVSIIIPFYNEEAYTWNCLIYLHRHLTGKIPFEILLIDDNSPENCDFGLIEGIINIRNSENLGFLKNINKGIGLAKGEYIYILNNDTEVHAHFLEELFFVFENFKDVGAVSSKLLNADGSLQEAGAVFLKDCDIRQIGHKKEPFYPEVNYICKIDYGSGCSLLFKKYSDDGQMNLLDEQYIPAYFEETDFCFKLKYLQGKHIYYTPFSELLHYNGVTYNSAKNTDESKLLKKEVLFKTNLEKFKTQWAAQLHAIQAPTIEERIQEIYGQSVVVFSDALSKQDAIHTERLQSIITTFIEMGFHVTLIGNHTAIDTPNIEVYQRLGANVFFGHQKYNGYQKYLRKQKSHASVVWFYGPETFKKYHSVAKKHISKARLFYDMADIDSLKVNAAEPFSVEALKKQIHQFIIHKNDQ